MAFFLVIVLWELNFLKMSKDVIKAIILVVIALFFCLADNI